MIEECYKKSIILLLNNSNDYGLLASAPSDRAKQRNYLSIFARDASICAMGMVASKNLKLIAIAEKSLKNLAAYQANNGQIPNYIKPETKTTDFWYLGCIDATLWWLIAIKFFDRYSTKKSLLKNRLKQNIAKAISWLEAQEHQKFYLLEQNEASDWADIMPRSGYVLYSNVLWFWVKKLYKLKTINKTKKNFNFLFYPWQKIPLSYFKETRRAKKLINYIKNGHNKLPHYLSFVNYSFWGKETDVYANLLACLLDLPDKKLQAKIADCLQKEKNNSPLPIKTCFHPIKQNDKLWRPYMLEHKQNHPEQYHNGGIWPFISCLWPMLIHKNGGQNKAWQELKKVALANKLNNWEFNEWLHGQTGKPLGMAGQSWNAGMFLLAYHYLNNQIKI
ncbi:glycoside hydrolase [Candidatus Falkowbacteria bacterium RIFCSPHIGHO2_02_FULL_42_9]|uniref:beta-fructofuranosidase n=1 Tax=Candidatus Falkowbacteria bacterium RIFCSPHIGHO2_02_FULL_42_9 TaxID=1797986 RepID=A0A1F5S6P3_9BACT|nr:MAG: glycoside hydrolase [Candidatus Falkowbacteria bacterium RIFCSPHIGHO2_02_FULL_42_9]